MLKCLCQQRGTPACTHTNNHTSVGATRWCPMTFNFLPVPCYKNHPGDVKLRACTSWVCIKAQVMFSPPPRSFAHFLAVKCSTDRDRSREREREGYREGGRLWIGRVSGMHGQPLCLSKTLQQLPARDKSNHSQPTPPFPPPTHKHTHQYTFLLSVSLSHTHTHTHIQTHTFTCTSASLQVSTKMQRFRAAFVTSQRSSLQIILFLCLFLWRQNTAGLNIGWGGEVWGESPFFFSSLTASNHMAPSRQQHRFFYGAVNGAY